MFHRQDSSTARLSAFGWPWVADLLEELGHPVHLGHPPAIKVLALGDQERTGCDGNRLGKFQLRGILPESYLAPPAVRQIRASRRVIRMALSRLRSGVKSRVQAILHRLGILHPFSDLFGKAGRRFLQSLPFPGRRTRRCASISTCWTKSRRGSPKPSPAI